MSDRGWIIRPLLDLEATDEEVVAAGKAATSGELEAVQRELEMGCWWVGLRQRDIEGKMAHLKSSTLRSGMSPTLVKAAERASVGIRPP